MKPFVVNSHRRLVFPSNFFPEPDFSSIDTVEDLAAIVRRDFEVKAPPGSETLDCHESVPELEALRRWTMTLHNQYPWDRSDTLLTSVGALKDDDVVVYQPRTLDVMDFIRRVKNGAPRRPRVPPALPPRQPTTPLAPVQVRSQFPVQPRIEAIAVRRGEIFGDGAAALVVAPAPDGPPGDVDVLQTYASGPESQVNSIIWPNVELGCDITVYGPEVKAVVKRYLEQSDLHFSQAPFVHETTH